MSEPAVRLEITTEDVSAALAQIMGTSGARGVTLDPANVQHDLAKIVLVLMEFLRRLLELQAIRRMEKGVLSEDEEEQLGLTLMRAKEQILLMAGQFGIGGDQLNLDLGPLGKLM